MTEWAPLLTFFLGLVCGGWLGMVFTNEIRCDHLWRIDARTYDAVTNKTTLLGCCTACGELRATQMLGAEQP